MTKEKAFLLWCISLILGAGLFYWKANTQNKTEQETISTTQVVGFIDLPDDWTSNGDGQAVVLTKHGDVHVIIVGTFQDHPPTDFVLHTVDSIDDLDGRLVVVTAYDIIGWDRVVAKTIEEIIVPK